ncbi:MAG: hypothetical protein V3T17_03625 [Pseudomonadales bacterium]
MKKSGVNALVHDPELGIDMDDDTSRCGLTLSFGKGAYIVRYVLEDEYKEILILRIWHSKEDRD